MKLINFLNGVIQYSFYGLFLLVPLVFSGATSELFEFPKMWLTFVLTIIIGAGWITKMILQRRIQIQRTPLDIPLILFLLSQIISTIYSLDPHVSLWGFYSRFNGGLLSIISYIFLYYALISNLKLQHVLKILSVSLFSGFIVALWGFPSHFGIDPTCFFLRGSLDTTCWTDAFKPTIRIFSTLGQPAWLTAYLSILIPIVIAYFLIGKQGLSQLNTKYKEVSSKHNGNEKTFILYTLYFILVILFYTDLLFTNTRGGFIGFWIANILFWAIVIARSHSQRDDKAISNTRLPRSFQSLAMTWKAFLLFNLSFLILNFLQGVPITQISKFTLPEIIKQTENNATLQNSAPTVGGGALGGTDSGKIRLLVWRGAIDAWRDNPVIGTGVETFAYAYYKYKPLEHNLTSEWDYLYNKAHNEYLNYLTTTGILGLGSYLAIIGMFIFQFYKRLLHGSIAKLLKTNNKTMQQSNNSHHDLDKQQNTLLILGLFCGWISILISNFFGFSVVIINLYFFLIPAFVFILEGMLNPDKALVLPARESVAKANITKRQYALFALLLLVMSYLLLVLINYLRADIIYARGSSLNKGGAYQEAYTDLVTAVNIKKNEPVYKDELSINIATIASTLYLQKKATMAATLTSDAISLSDEIVGRNPNNVVFWKNRVRLFYTLAQGDPANEKTYLVQALTSLEKAQELAPTDAKISYNLGVLYGQLDDFKKAITLLESSVKLKPDYRDAYFALGLFYDEIGERPKAIEAYEYILKNIDPEDEQVKESLTE